MCVPPRYATSVEMQASLSGTKGWAGLVVEAEERLKMLLLEPLVDPLECHVTCLGNLRNGGY